MTDIETQDERTVLAQERNRLARSRTRLANKRTFLAWCRTALSFMTFGFLLEKIDTYLSSKEMGISDAILSDLGLLGTFAFVGGPLLMLFAGWQYYRLEKEIGFAGRSVYIFPELVLFGVVLGGALLYVFA